VVYNLGANALRAAIVFAPDVTLADAMAMLPLCGVGFQNALGPGTTPDQTALYAEGCADVDAPALLEAWVKHSLVGINTWLEAGVAPLHKDWRGLAHGMGEDITMGAVSGTYLGVDERFGMLVRDAATTHLFPLTDVLEGR